jgi:hypothetical protein
MLEVTSFLRVSNDFVPVVEFTGKIADPDYIEGAIELRLDEKCLLDHNDWDYIDQLWAYFADGLVKVAAGEEFSTYFPDQPIEVLFQPDQEFEQVSIQVKSGITVQGSVQYGEFMEVMIRAGRTFFHRMAEIVPDSRDFYTDIEQRLSSIKWKRV